MARKKELEYDVGYLFTSREGHRYIQGTDSVMSKPLRKAFKTAGWFFRRIW